jgi:hypothetical protein
LQVKYPNLRKLKLRGQKLFFSVKVKTLILIAGWNFDSDNQNRNRNSD